jgi:N-acetylglucosaminyl-diphospho-decaprenol L-rhamnosyltransferase
MPPTLAVIVVSTNEARWLRPCLSTVFEHPGALELDVVVVDNESSDGTRDLVEEEFPEARVVSSLNKGFAHANNRGVFATNAEYLLFLNPDTEILDGTFENVVHEFEQTPALGLVGVKQVTADGELFPTIRRFPTPMRYWGEAFASEKLPVRAAWLGERELDMARYECEVDCDWTSGSFMLARREALESAGYLDERFFIYSEEVDLCLRIKNAGWAIRHVPSMTILHHAGKAGFSPRMTAQEAYARRQYLRKHFGPVRRAACASALYFRHGIRAVAPGRDSQMAPERRRAARAALRVLIGADPPPFGEPPARALALRPRDVVTEGEGFEPSKSLHP